MKENSNQIIDKNPELKSVGIWNQPNIGKNPELNPSEVWNQQNKQYSNIAFSGGGAKGAIMMGAIEPLETRGIIQEINGISGSSAGSIVGGLIATGAKAKDFERLSKTPLTSLLGSGIELPKEMKLSSDGEPLYKLLQSEIRNNVLDRFCEYEIKGTELKYDNDSTELHYKLINIELVERLENQNNLTKEQKKQIIKSQESAEKDLEDFYKNKLKLSDQELQKRMSNSKTITYRDLKTLRKNYPETFKDLNVTATRISDKELVVFNAENHPDTEIALSIRASASFPVVFEDVEIDGVRYFDGGFRDNIPQDERYFKKDERTLVLAFIDDKNLKNLNAIHEGGDKKIEKPKRGFTGGVINTVKMSAVSSAHSSAVLSSFAHSGNTSSIFGITSFLSSTFKIPILKDGRKMANILDESNTKTLNQLRENALNVILLNSNDVSTLDFKKAAEKSAYLYRKGSLITQHHLENHSIINADPSLSIREYIMAVYEKNISIVGDLDRKIKEIDDELREYIKADSELGEYIEADFPKIITFEEKLKEKAKIKKERDNALQNNGLVEFHNGNLLGFCESNAFEDRQWESTLNEFIDRLRNPIIIKNAVDILNKKTTPDSVKAAFMFQFGIEDLTKEKVASYVFTQENIKEHQSIIRNISSEINDHKKSFVENLKQNRKSSTEIQKNLQS